MNKQSLLIGIICLVGFLEAVIYGFSFPFFSLALEDMNLSPFLIGLNASVGTVGVLFFAPFFPKLIIVLGYRNFSMLCFGGVIFTCFGKLLTAGLISWFIFRLLLGAFLSGLWTASEAWLNASITNEKIRGRTNAIFQALYSFGFFIGPNAIYITGFEGVKPVLFMLALGSVALAALILAVANKRSTLGSHTTVPYSTIKSARFPLCVALLVGICETAIYSLLPIYGIEKGLSTNLAVSILVAYTFGEVIIALPIGWLADIMDRRKLMIYCSILASVFVFLFTFPVKSHLGIWFISAIAGGLVVSLYNLALVLIGEKYNQIHLPVVSTAFSIFYSVGSFMGASVGGSAMGLFGFIGLPGVISSMLLIFALLMLFGSLGRSWFKTLPEA